MTVQCGELKVIDSHVGNEPARLVIDGFLDPGTGDMSKRRGRFSRDYDDWRKAIIPESCGNDVLVGVSLCEPVSPQVTIGVIFSNNCGFLNVYGHGTIGLITPLAQLGRIQPGKHLIEAPVGDVTATLRKDGSVLVENVSAHRWRRQIQVETVHGTVTGNITQDGNRLFLVSDHSFIVSPEKIPELIEYAWATREGLGRAGIRGEHDGIIDHIELFIEDNHADSRNFVFCLGKAWDRSPCGTGTNAKLACLVEDGKLKSGESWRRVSITGNEFTAHFVPHGDKIVPTVRGKAWARGDNKLTFNPEDSLCWGILL